MRIIDINKERDFKYSTGVALGNFDGLHLGHRALIKRLIVECKNRGLTPSVLLFTNHTKTILNNKSAEFEILTTNDEKCYILEKLGVEVVYTLPFDENIRSLTSSEFVEKILVKMLNIKLAVVGFDYRFGYMASGNSNELILLGKNYDFHVDLVKPFYVDNELVSSTMIRHLIKEGKIEKANKYLASKYSLRGLVIPGDNRGRKLGFPTANINLLSPYVIPKTGVYLTNVNIDNHSFLGLTNIGYNPTFNGNKLKIETYILHFYNEIYNKEIEIVFLEFIRDDIKFDTKEELIDQMNKDLIFAKNKSNIYKVENI